MVQIPRPVNHDHLQREKQSHNAVGRTGQGHVSEKERSAQWKDDGNKDRHLTHGRHFMDRPKS